MLLRRQATNSSNAAISMMMWHYVWWCDTMYGDVTLCMMMWHCVWWCATMYDDVTRCMMMWQGGRQQQQHNDQQRQGPPLAAGYRAHGQRSCCVQGAGRPQATQGLSLSLFLSLSLSLSIYSVQGAGCAQATRAVETKSLLRRIHVYISFHLICVCVCVCVYMFRSRARLFSHELGKCRLSKVSVQNTLIRGGVENTYISTTGTLLQYSLK